MWPCGCMVTCHDSGGMMVALYHSGVHAAVIPAMLHPSNNQFQARICGLLQSHVHTCMTSVYSMAVLSAVLYRQFTDLVPLITPHALQKKWWLFWLYCGSFQFLCLSTRLILCFENCTHLSLSLPLVTQVCSKEQTRWLNLVYAETDCFECQQKPCSHWLMFIFHTLKVTVY